MSAVKAWVIAICVVSVACTVIEILFPQGKMEKIFKVVLGVFMLCSLLVPLKNTLANINFNAKKPENSFNDKSKLESTIDDQTINTSKKNLKLAVEKVLEKINVKPKKVNIIMDTNKEDCISIRKIQVYLLRGDEAKKDIIKNELEKKLELKIEVVVGSE